jgi:hypothetical protein
MHVVTELLKRYEESGENIRNLDEPLRLLISSWKILVSFGKLNT